MADLTTKQVRAIQDELDNGGDHTTEEMFDAVVKEYKGIISSSLWYEEDCDACETSTITLIDGTKLEQTYDMESGMWSWDTTLAD